MLIGILSDTHGFLDERIFDHFADCEEVWHAGDFGTMEVIERLRAFKPLRGVYGNIDDAHIRVQMPEDLRFVCAGVPVYMTHIGGYPGKYAPRVRKILQAEPPRGGLFVCGHSHILKIMPDRQGDFLHINPGACGNEGWHRFRTVVRLRLEEGTIQGVEVIELGPRRALG